MDVYETVMDYLHTNSLIQPWPELEAILKRAENNAPREWILPLTACEAVGGEPGNAVPAMAAIGCLQTAIILIDDMLDADPRGEYRQIGAPRTANDALALYAIGLQAVIRSSVDQVAKLEILRSLNEMMLTTALGQQMDQANPKDEAAYQQLVCTKSSPFFGSALFSGAIAGEGEKGLAGQIERFGHLYGEMIQIHDDLNDAMQIPANPDWEMGRASLPILFAKTVDHPEREQFCELLGLIKDEDALKEAQGILIRCGAVSYAVDSLIRMHRESQKILDSMHLNDRLGLEKLSEDVIHPVVKMLSELGIEQPLEML